MDRARNIMILAFNTMKISRIIRDRLLRPITMKVSWSRLMAFHLAVKHSQLYIKRSCLHHLRLLCSIRKRKRNLVTARNYLHYVLAKWIRRINVYSLKRLFFRWTDIVFNDEVLTQKECDGMQGLLQNVCFKDVWKDRLLQLKCAGRK